MFLFKKKIKKKYYWYFNTMRLYFQFNYLLDRALVGYSLQ